MRGWVAVATTFAAAVTAISVAFAAAPTEPAATPPPTLEGTGLYADFRRLAVNPAHLAFQPQYPLWTDGASKRRWISLPPGTAIDGSDPNNWVFPVGTRLWKEFSFGGQRVETRYLQLTDDGTWLYAAYAWSEDGKQAELVSDRGRRGAYPLPGGRSHAIPSVSDCKVCHGGGRGVVLGFSALQLSPDRDPGALHLDPVEAVVDLPFLIEAGLLVGYPEALAASPPRIDVPSTTARAALGYLHGNCGHCHDRPGKLENLGLFLRHVLGSAEAPGVASTVAQPVRKRAPGQSLEALLRIEPGHPERSALAERVASRYAGLQMPPLGTELVDQDAVALIRRWIAELDDHHQTTTREGLK